MERYNPTSNAFSRDVLDLPLDISVLTGPGTSEPAGQEPAVPEHSDSISDALIKCIRDTGRVDISRIAASADVTEDEAVRNLRGSIYLDPDKWDGKTNTGWETADEYLSGNLRYKLIKARVAYRTYGRTFGDNVRALEAILPPEVAAEDIYVTLGSPWLPESIVDDFVNYLIQPHDYHRCRGTIHDEETGSWEIPDKAIYSRYIRSASTYGTSRIDAVHIIERTLNMKTIKITDEVRSETSKTGKTRVINREETAAAQEKQNLILAEFRRWIWKDPVRRKKVKQLFENKYSCMTARRFDGRFLEFPGMSEEVELFPYQKDAVARILFTPNTLLAHDVGAGKTYIMAAAAMELKRLGMSERNLFVVPNNLVEQWRSIFISIYPEAKLLCVEPKDFSADRRNRTLRMIIENSYDGIIMAYSCFDRIPLSRKYYVDELRAEKERLERAKSRKKDTTSRFKSRLKKISEELGKAAVASDPSREFICFDDLGIDRLFVDEAHNYKNVSVDTAIFGVFGINRSGSVKCDRMMDKVHHVQKTHGGGGVVMATGTPITNSVSDIYIFQKYLQSGELELLGLQTFDSWVGMFAEKTTEFEIAVDTNSYRLATRFSSFHNIPELTTILASIADFHSIDRGDGIPQFSGYTDVVIPRTHELREYLEDISRRADRVHQHKVHREHDNMLRITGDGRKAALDIRLVSPAASSDEASLLYDWKTDKCKVSECAMRAAKIWYDTSDDRLTQLVFCDTSTPKAGFNIYEDLRRRLVSLGVKDSEIAFIHDAATEAKRDKLFRSVRNGSIRILIGSTFKLGLGVNVQDRLIAIHHLDLPWRPADMVQREGRILRTGNMNPEVRIFRYITEGSFDAYSWQLLETKQRFISDILSGTASGRSGGEVDDTVLNYAEIKALALGNPLLRSRVETRNEITRLSMLRKQQIDERLRLEKRYDELPDAIAAKEHELETCTSDAKYAERFGRDIYKDLSTADKKALAGRRNRLRVQLAEYLYDYVMKARDKSLIEYRGFLLVLPAGMEENHPFMYIVREGRYRVDMGDKETGILIRIDNYIDKLGERAQHLQRQLDLLRQEQKEIEEELSREETLADRMEELTRKLDGIDAELGVRERRNA